MSIREGLRTYLSDQLILRTCLYLAVALGVALLIMWPRGSLEAAVRSGATSDTFTVVAVCFLILMLLISARFGAQDFSADPSIHIQEYVRLTPVPLLRLVSGRAAFASMHTVLLLLLGAPFLAASLAVGGARLTHLFLGLIVIGASGLAARSCGLLFLCIFGERRSVRDLILSTVLVALLVTTFFVAPSSNPFRALSSLLEPASSFPEWLLSTLASCAGAICFFALSILALRVVRAKAKGKNRG